MVSSTPKETWDVRLVFNSLGTKVNIKWLWDFCLQQGERFSLWPLIGLVQHSLAKEMAEDQRKGVFFLYLWGWFRDAVCLRLHKYLIFQKSPVYSWDKRWGSWEKKQQGKGVESFLWFPLTGQGQWAKPVTQEKLLHCEDSRYGNRLPREVVESPFLHILLPYLDMVLCNLLKMSLLYTGKMGLDDLQRPLLAPAILWSVSLDRTFLHSYAAYSCSSTAQRNSIPYDHNFPPKTEITKAVVK